jgi:N6-adenosine-specific RNA methylase IME4
VARGEKEILKAAKEIRAKKVEQRRQKRLEQIGAIEEMAPLDGKYHVIVADPPWPYEKRAEDITHRGVCPYPSMTLEEICAKPVGELAQDDAVLWLWTTNAFMKEAYQVAEAWGFEVKTILTWAKVRMGLGDWLRGQTEHCLMAVRGKPIVNLTNQTTLLHGEVREHSRKPEEFYQFVETLCAGKKCELFSRTRRQGWAQEGAELDQFTAA